MLSCQLDPGGAWYSDDGRGWRIDFCGTNPAAGARVPSSVGRERRDESGRGVRHVGPEPHLSCHGRARPGHPAPLGAGRWVAGSGAGHDKRGGTRAGTWGQRRARESRAGAPSTTERTREIVQIQRSPDSEPSASAHRHAGPEPRPAMSWRGSTRPSRTVGDGKMGGRLGGWAFPPVVSQRVVGPGEVVTFPALPVVAGHGSGRAVGHLTHRSSRWVTEEGAGHSRRDDSNT
jgi:hypothetical protein